jgi:hypothetical protein
MRKVIPVFIVLLLISLIVIIKLQPKQDNNHIVNSEQKQDNNSVILDEKVTKEPDKLEYKNKFYIIDRTTAIPDDLDKITPDQDLYPPQLHSTLYEEPIPMPGPINTAGAEDSPFILPCGCDFYFVFVPDIRIPPEKQLIDGASGIYVTKKVDGTWVEPERVILNDDVSLDGCHFIQGDTMWFCSVRAGNFREVDLYNAHYENGMWTEWNNVGEKLNVEFQVGEMHISSDGSELFFHSNREGGFGGTDIWVTRMIDGEWLEPTNVEAVNSVDNEGMPFLNQAGEELWFNKQYLGSPGIYVSKKVDGVWREPQLVLSQFAGEPSLDETGNIYFVHHFYKDGVMLEADIYVAYRKPRINPVDYLEKPSRGFFTGILPTPFEEQNFDEAYRFASESCELIPIWGKPSPYWEKVEDLNGSWGKLFVEELTRGNNMAPLLHFSFIGENLSLSSPPRTNYLLSNPEWRFQYKKAIIESVEVVKPKYLSIGNEVNRWYEKYGWDGDNGFKYWVSLYEEIYYEVKELSPDTIVFCTFSREIVSENREADMDVLNYFNPATLDLLVLTSYPHSLAGVNKPSDIPSDYYSNIVIRVPGKSVAFSEITWPSLPHFGGEQSQVDFIDRLDGDLIDGVEMEFIMWSWLTDIAESDYTGLIRRDGTHKLGYQAWTVLADG